MCLDVNVSCHAIVDSGHTSSRENLLYTAAIVHNPFRQHFQCAYHAIIYAAQAMEL
jgi:hypothetical protein